MDGDIVQVNGDEIIYRASALGGCLEALAFARMEYDPVPPPKNMQKVFDRGHAAEADILEKVRSDGWKLFDEQVRVEVVVTNRITVVGHVDALGSRDHLGVIVEAKSQSEAEWETWTPDWEQPLWRKYKWQTSIYMLALDMPLLMARGLVVDGEVKDVKWQIVERPWYGLPEIRARVLTVEAMAAKGVVVCQGKMFPCPYVKFHAEDRELCEDDELRTWCLDYVVAQTEVKNAEDKRKRLQEKILKRAGTGRKLLFTDGTPMSTWEQAGGPDRFNVKRMKEDGVDVDKYKIPKTKSPRIKVGE